MNGPTKEQLSELFELLSRQSLTDSRKVSIFREPDDENMRVSLTRIEKSDNPHCWKSTDPGRKNGIVRWTCTKCGGWVDSPGAVRPNGHLAPTCSEMMVDNVHGL